MSNGSNLGYFSAFRAVLLLLNGVLGIKKPSASFLGLIVINLRIVDAVAIPLRAEFA